MAAASGNLVASCPYDEGSGAVSFTLSPRLRKAYEAKAAANPNLPPLDVPWGYAEVAAYLQVRKTTVVVYRDRTLRNRNAGNPRPGDLPDPDGSMSGSRGHWWYPKTIIKWDADDRPGQGVGGGRPWHKEKNR